ncbi:MAG: SEL1-like repeat protein [Betaproteobacteria bacterium]|nr:SEL1-like repeat protein [Betaproteobacteria bacterium]
MNTIRLPILTLVIFALGMALFASFPAAAQAPASKYEVRKGDTLFGIARKTRHAGVTINQMVIAIFNANRSTFPGENPRGMAIGTVLEIPGKEAVAAMNRAEADRLVREYLAKWAAVPPPAPAPTPAPPATAKPAPPPQAIAPPKPPAGPLTPEEAAKRYRDGLALERKGDNAGALKAFLEAGESGHGPAQKRLGQIYDKGNSVVPHDYQTSLRWYQKAREQGEEIPKPLPKTPR